MRAMPTCLIVGLGLCTASIGCGADDLDPIDAQADTQADVEAALSLAHHDPNPMLFPRQARPFGRSLERWSELLWSWIYAQPFDENPILDPTGADCAVGQQGPVWFLAAVPGSMLGTTVDRTCAIPRHKAILVQLASLLNDFPCPDPAFHPAPGQSLFDFLIEPVTPIFDNETGFVITFDGVELVDPLSYRFTSDDLFFFKGDLSMQAFDSCVTGRRQPAVSDGFYLPFRPMSPGEHTIVINGHDMMGVAVTLTWHLTIR
jgi:hypothetical protein